ncbi:hypothetical protein P691DRAFT_806186 [Macrolepiota fuliginosa MF-IS2]|uniref:Uncharacterized protein n=1 Tax=Macrolepiota fuliginosa MF-IS2 TaxID=1400762 RepID=A0A9P5X6P0_9AGAR|nr:hypothetical protein P691DRAFT_806186 [Macrolepiota fuliginosa MF-IS2]
MPFFETPMVVSGYYINFKQTLAAMRQLGIECGDVQETLLEYPINSWLAGNNMMNVLAGSIRHPRSSRDSFEEDGILLMTRFEQFPRDDGQTPHFEEREQDCKVKEWLIEEGGVQADQMEWLSLWDRYGLTLNGTRPRIKDVPEEPELITDELYARWKANGGGLNLTDWLFQDVYGRWETDGQEQGEAKDVR